MIVPVICPALHRSGDIYRFAGASDTDVQQAHFLNKPVWHFLRIHDPASTRRTRAYTSSFAPRANPSRPVETRNARNENGVPLEPLSGVNGHHRDIRIKVIGETPQGALGKDAHDIVEALRGAHRDAVIFKGACICARQCLKSHSKRARETLQTELEPLSRKGVSVQLASPCSSSCMSMRRRRTGTWRACPARV